MTKEEIKGEVVIKEYPRTSYWLEGKRVRAAGNLILTNERLVFIHQMGPLSDKEMETLSQISQENDTTKLINFCLKLQKNNFQVPVASIIRARMGLLSYVPIRPFLRVFYKSESKKVKELEFLFSVPIMKRLLMSEFPHLGWSNVINREVKRKQKARAKKKA